MLPCKCCSEHPKSCYRTWAKSGLRLVEAVTSCQHLYAHWTCGLQTAAEISKSAMDNSDQLAVEAVDLFLALIGAEAGHMGLRSLASGGIYICGGIMPKVRCCLSLMQSASPFDTASRETACVWLYWPDDMGRWWLVAP